jgi:hypothetical protein
VVKQPQEMKGVKRNVHQGREIIAIGALENGAFCTVFSENFQNFSPSYNTVFFFHHSVHLYCTKISKF